MFRKRSTADPVASHEFIFETLKWRATLQESHATTLDSKANLSTVSSVILAAAAMLMSGASNSQQGLFGGWTAGWNGFLSIHTFLEMSRLLMAAVLLLTLTCSFMAYRLGEFRYAPAPKAMLDEYWNMSLIQARADVCNAIAESLDCNHVLLKRKATWVARTHKALYAQGLILLAIVIASVYA